MLRHHAEGEWTVLMLRHHAEGEWTVLMLRHHAEGAWTALMLRHHAEGAWTVLMLRHHAEGAWTALMLRHHAEGAWTALIMDSASPPRRGRMDSPDASPPRRGRMDSPDASPPRRGRMDSPDASPPRRGRMDSPDASPPRRAAPDRPASSPAQQGRKKDSSDASPPRKRKAPEDLAAREAKKPNKVVGFSTGEAHGLTSGEQLKFEIEKKKARESAMLKDAESLGRGAETIRRDRHGRRLEMLEQMEKQEQGIVDDEDQNRQWGMGDQQKDDQQEKARRLEEEKYTAFARRADDVEMNSVMKEQDRWGDPMAGLVKVKGPKSKEYKGYAPPNRFGIKPSTKWDGVDRSNAVSYTHLRAHETVLDLVCRLLLEKKKQM
eukprot:TRINITY_DN3496_c0_g1_i1.p1 TRINITY_DN3496_c0_g1~~TRINITY_DN3496_c0_g1_i1.p1  ORF type:complete len:377 (-),score=54.18 TRINITY_DN3496_c0_g1_i1:22-1152(-)